MAGDILRVVGDEKEARTMVEARKAALGRQERRGQRPGDPRGPLPPDPGRSGQGAADHPQVRRVRARWVPSPMRSSSSTRTRSGSTSCSRAPATSPTTTSCWRRRRTRSSSASTPRSPRRRVARPRAEGVDVRLYDIIYKLTDDIGAALKGLLEPEIVEVVEGRAEVRQVIRVGKSTVIAGSFVTDGRIVRGGNARVWRGSKVIATDRIESLRRFRDDVREVQQNYECGIGLANFHDIVEGDIIECFTSADGEPGRPADGPDDRSRPMSQRTDRVDELLRQEIGAIVARDVADPRIGFVDDHRGRDDAGPAPCQGLGQRHRPARRARGRGRGAAPRDAVHPPRARASGCGIRRIPDLHVHLDDTAERGTRVLQLLAELETGREPGAATPAAESLPTPVARLHQADDLAAEPPSAVRSPSRHASLREGPGTGRRRRASASSKAPRKGRGDASTSTPYLAPSRRSSSSGCAAARRVLAVGHENPDADTLGATLGVVPARRGHGGPADRRLHRPAPAALRLPAGVERVPDRPGPGRDYDLVVISDCGSLERVGAVGARHAELFARLPRVVIDHHASNDAVGRADWIDPAAAATCEMVTLLAARLGVPLDVDGGRWRRR